MHRTRNPNQLFLPLDMPETGGTGSPPPPEVPVSCRDIDGLSHALISDGRPVCCRSVSLRFDPLDLDPDVECCVCRQRS